MTLYNYHGLPVPPLPVRHDSLPKKNNQKLQMITNINELSSLRVHLITTAHDKSCNKNSKTLNNMDQDQIIEKCKLEEQSETLSPYVFDNHAHYESSFKSLYEFYKSGKLSDVEVIVGNTTFKAHKIVLACCSEYFCEEFSSSDSPINQVTVKDDDIESESVEELIQYCYLGQIGMTVDNVLPLLHTSSVLRMQTVAEACSEFLSRQIHVTNCLAVHDYARVHGHPELTSVTTRFIIENFLEFVERDEVRLFSLELMRRALTSPDLNVDDEAQVYEAVVDWVKHDEAARKHAMASLLAYVKLPLLSPAYLVASVEGEPLMNRSLECRDLLDEAKRYQMSLVSLLPDVKVTTSKTVARRSYAGVVLCVGGRGASGAPFLTTECYDIRSNTWHPVASMEERRRHVGVCSASGLVYAVGGHNGHDHLSSCEIFHPSLNKWTRLASIKTKRRGVAVACLGGPLYVAGGLDDDTSYKTTERYDASTDTWCQVADLNVARGGVCVVALKGHLYAVGGNDGTSSLASCERYDPFLNKWVMVSDMSERRAGAGAAVLNSYLYVVGGFSGSKALLTAERYDPHTDTWTPISEMTTARGGVGLATLGGRLYAAGGHDGIGYLNSVEAYNPVTDSWERTGSIDGSRAGAGIVFCDCPAGILLDGLT